MQAADKEDKAFWLGVATVWLRLAQTDEVSSGKANC
jgi:hypothetical protein